MTLVDIKNALLSHFLACPTFNVTEDLGIFKLNPKEVEPNFIDNLAEIVTFGLEDLSKLGIVAKVKDGLYILVQPLNQLNQTVVVSPVTSLMIADIVNGWTTNTGEQKETGYVVNKLSITDRDLQALCSICHTLLSFDDEPFEEDDAEEKNQ